MKIFNQKIIAVYLLVFYVTFQSYAQTPASLVDFIPRTPEGSLLESFGNIEANSNTGMPDITIPLYTIRVDNIELPITLSYIANGIRVNDVATPVGLKWLLNYGGMVTREVIGVPDELNSTKTGWIHMVNNHWAHLQSSLVTCDIDYNYVFYSGQFDYAPDHFNYSLIDNGNSFIFKPGGDRFQTKKSPNVIQTNISTASTLDSYFEIIDTKGISYLFSEKEYNSVYSKRTSSLNQSLQDYGAAPVGWKLSRITSPLGRMINFFYEGYSYQTGWHTTGHEYITDPSDNAGEPSSIYGMFTKTSNIISDVKLISSIETETDSISFIYSYDNNLSVMKKKLSEIKIYDKNHIAQPIKVIKFFYQVFPGEPKLMLKSLTIFGNSEEDEISYSFNYQLDNHNLPSLGSSAQDFFGFFNSNSSPWLIPIFPPNTFEPADREIDPDKITFGVLEELIYPTGGKTKFIYEPNMETTIDELLVFYPGIRVAKIINYGITGDEIGRKEFIYGPAISSQKRILSNDFSHFVFTPSAHPLLFYYPYKVFSSEPNELGQINPPVKGFGYLDFSVTTPENGFSKKLYDYFLVGSNYEFLIKKEEIFGSNNEKIKSIYRNYSIKTEFNSIEPLQTMETFQLGGQPFQFSGYFTCGNIAYCSALPDFFCNDVLTMYPQMSNSLTYYQTLIELDKKNTINYFGVDSLITQEEYFYDEFQQVTRSVFSILEPSENIFNFYFLNNKYITDPDVNWVSLSTKNSLLSANIISTPLLSEKFSDGSLKIEGSKLFLNDKGQVLKQYAWETENQSTGQGSYELFGKYEYDTLSHRLIESEIRNTPASYIWGYNNTLPIAKLENISQNQIPSNLNNLIQQLETFSGDLTANDRDSIINLNNQIRNVTTSLVMITTYTHKPLVGVTSITDPRGQTIFYEYDSFGRLKAIRDQDGKILEENEYHYAQPQ